MDRPENLKTWSLLTTWFLMLSSSQLSLAQEPPSKEKTIQTITVSAKSLNEGLLLPSVKTLSGDELIQNLGSSLGETLNSQLGLSATGFGAGASRPIIRGMEGSRVLVLENGMAMSDVSGLSNDHAVANGLSHTKEIEILRGSAALVYGSAPGGGVINIITKQLKTIKYYQDTKGPTATTTWGCDTTPTPHRKQLHPPDEIASPITPRQATDPNAAGRSPPARAAPAGQRVPLSPSRGGWQHRGQLPAPEC
jgi:outer membrane cobalamin receptor